MKKILIIAAVVYSGIAFAQPQIVKQAIITTTTTVIAPEGEEVQNIQQSGGGGGSQFFRNFGDGETKSTTYIKDDLVKTIMKSDMGRTTIIRNNGTKLTTTLLEIMGNRTGFYITDEEQVQMKEKMDSMMRTRKNSDSGKVAPPPVSNSGKTEISYVEEIKKINGFNCKKAYIINSGLLGFKDSVTVWYNPEIKFEFTPSTGGTSSFGGFGNMGNFTSLKGTELVNGFIMKYEMKMRRGRIMTVEVTKIDLKKEITEKEFEIPKDFEVKPMKEFQSMMQGSGGGMRMQMERH